jgi:hypothetical protein
MKTRAALSNHEAESQLTYERGRSSASDSL